ncbi:MAG: phage major capsid protein [Sulfitobacter sp.]
MPLDMEIKDALAAEMKTALTDALKERDQKSTDMAEQIDVLKTKSEANSADIKSRIDTSTDEIKKLNGTIDALEKKMARANAPSQRKSLGEQFIESDEFKGYDHSQAGRIRFESKDILNSGNLAAGVSRSVLVPEQQSGFIAPPQIDLRIRSLFATGQTSSNSIRSIKETGYTNSAASVAEGGAKPQSELTFGEAVIPVQKIAHKFRVSMEALEDAPMMRSYIDGRGRYGLDLVEEEQILRGNGTSPNLAGILPEAVAYNAATLAGYTPDTLVDDIRVAKLQVRKALYPASGVVMSPDDWAEIELLKDADNRYLFSSVTTGASPTLWGMPVVTSDSMDKGDFLIGAFSLGAMIWDRMGMTVMASTEDGDNFSENMVTILFEKRLALEVTRPEAFVYHNAVA